MKKIKVMSVFGTRPEAIKMAPLLYELSARPEFESVCCVTAQHREMLDSVLSIFGIKPDIDLNIMSRAQTLPEITSRVLTGLSSVLEREKPDIVLVHGDTSTTFAGALAAFYQKIKVGHVEAGLRTYDRYSPFPEEMNRRMTGALAELHFCPTAANAENLRREGISEGVFITGNTVIDAMKYTVRRGLSLESCGVPPEAEGKRLILLTCHRRENYGENMESIFRAVRRIAAEFEDTAVVYPVHLSPAVREAANKFLAGRERIYLTEPLDVDKMHSLMARCELIMTDSGGLQEEAPALAKPVLVLRRETERPEAVAAGTVKIAGVEENEIFSLASELLTDKAAYEKMAKAANPYGDGRACPRIAEAILWSFGAAEKRPEDFA